MKKKLFLTFVSVAMVSFAAYNSLLSNEDVSLSDMALENVEALADDINPFCPNGCLAIEDVFCYCYQIYELKEKNWDNESPSEPEE